MTVVTEDLILYRLDELKTAVESLTDKVDKQGLDVATLKVKSSIQSGLWGTLGGAIPAVATAVYWLLRE